MASSEFKINITKLVNSEAGDCQNVELAGDIPNEPEFSLVKPVIITGILTKLDEGIQGVFDFDTRAVFVCSRCAGEFEKDLHFSFEYVFEENDQSEYIINKDSTIDLYPIIREEIILSIPIKILCRENCEGVKNAPTEKEDV